MDHKYTSRITTKSDVLAMVDALNKMPGATVQSNETGYWLETKKGVSVFRAMVGSDGTYLVRYITDIFL